MYIVYNPTSGKRGLAEKISADAEAFFTAKGLQVKRIASTAAGHIRSLARQAAQQQCDAFVVVGGDGSCSEAAGGLAFSACALGIIPCGTGNDFCKTAHIPMDAGKAMALIANSAPRKTDVGIINGERIFLNEAGAGFDVDVLRHAEKYKKHLRGLLPYLLGLIGAALHYKTLRLTYTVNGEEHMNEEMTVCSVANGQFIGGGIQIAPLARIDDGRFDVEMLRPIASKRLPARILTLMRKKILEMPEMTRYLSDAVTIEGPGMFVNIDGEVVPMEKAEMKLLPGALLVYRGDEKEGQA